MPKLVLTDARLFVGAADLSGHSNKVEVSNEFDQKDITNFRSGGARELMAGLQSTAFTAEGQWEAGDPGAIDDQAEADRRVNQAWTVGATDASDTATGSVAYFTQALRTSITLFGSVGDVAAWSANASGSWPLVRGQFAHPSGTARSSSGNGDGLQLGAVLAGEYIYGSLHVVSVSGTTPSLTVAVESAPDNTFTTPTTRFTFNAATDEGGQIMRAAGPIADTWWRVTWTVSGTTPSFLFVAALGID